jgi:two-component system, sensor histidine kinase and response regulator
MSQGIFLSDSILDVPGTLSRLGGDRALLLELVGFLLTDAPACFQQLQRAVEIEDAEQVKFHAHSLKGLVAGCGGLRAAGAAQLVQTAAQTRDFSELRVLVESLRRELDSLQQALIEYRSQANSESSNGRPR